MTDFSLLPTALPNLHPALVHFPVALAFTALVLEAFSLALRKRTWLERAAAALYGLAAAGAVASYLAGRQAADSLGAVSATAELVLSDHADLALWTTGLLVIAAILRVLASLRAADAPVARLGLQRALGILVMLAAAAGLVRTADLGGALVYRHGVAVSRPAPAPGASRAAEPAGAGDTASAEARLVRSEDGSLSWTPLPQDAAALGTFVAVLPQGAATAAVPDEGTGHGLPVHVDGEAMLLLPGTWDDAAIDARLDLTGFEGTVGLAHHAASPAALSMFTLSTAGVPRLVRRSDGAETTLATGSGAVSEGPVGLRATAAGNHLKGFLDGSMVVHGHGRSGRPGRAGLYLDGTGTVRILSLTVRPIAGH